MTPFATATAAASAGFTAAMGEPITVGSTAGTGILAPAADLVIGGGIEVVNGARLSVLAADFPDLAQDDTVTRGAETWIVIDIDRAVDAGGWRHCVLVPE